ncbi:MAG TPA: glyoxalase superfamily protein [Acidimicrobiales bacterium]|nr:glyoxalase superfamily protein [Acidimicrobiales bacterium]
MPDVQVVIPVLPTTDLARAHTYYCDVLGFLEPWGFGEPPQYGGVRADLEQMPAIHFTVDPARGAGEVFVIIDEVDAYFEKVKAAGAQVVFEIGDRPYGMRDFMVADPDGNRLSFGTPTGAPT